MMFTQDSLSSIAYACGLCDQSHFTRRFTQVVGLTPSRSRYQQRSLSRHTRKRTMIEMFSVLFEVQPKARQCDPCLEYARFPTFSSRTSGRYCPGRRPIQIAATSPPAQVAQIDLL